MSFYWVLDEHGQPREEHDPVAWGTWFERATNTGERVLARTVVREGVVVSTVFLALDHGWGGKPLLYETMIFGGPEDGNQWRYGTRAEAEAGHTTAVARATASASTTRQIVL